MSRTRQLLIMALTLPDHLGVHWITSKNLHTPYSLVTVTFMSEVKSEQVNYDVLELTTPWIKIKLCIISKTVVKLKSTINNSEHLINNQQKSEYNPRNQVKQSKCHFTVNHYCHQDKLERNVLFTHTQSTYHNWIRSDYYTLSQLLSMYKTTAQLLDLTYANLNH